MIEVLYNTALILYMASMVIAAIFFTIDMGEVRATLQRGDRNFLRYPIWYQQLNVFLVASIFTFIPVMNTLTAVAAIVLGILRCLNDD